MSTMTAADIEQAQQALAESGYVLLRKVVPADELARFADGLNDAYDRALGAGELFEGGGMISGHLNCFPGSSARFAYDAVDKHGVLDIVRAHNPELLELIRITANYNLPGSHPQHYHSDGLYTEAFLICNVAVVDTDLVNGAIDVVPQTHKRFYKFSEFLAKRVARDAERICMEQGDVLLRSSTMWHRGMPNKSSVPRPMMAFTFGEKSGQAEPFSTGDQAPEFTPNWYGTDRLAQLREQTFVRAPWLYSAYRVSRSLVGNKGYSSW